jgi:hypothetical protein
MATKLNCEAGHDIKLLHTIKLCEGQVTEQYSHLDGVVVTHTMLKYLGTESSQQLNKI